MALEAAEKVLWRAPKGRGFSPNPERAPTPSTICGKGVGATGLKPRPSEALNSVFPQPLKPCPDVSIQRRIYDRNEKKQLAGGGNGRTVRADFWHGIPPEPQLPSRRQTHGVY